MLIPKLKEGALAKKKFKEALLKGIPSEIRPIMWQSVICF